MVQLLVCPRAIFFEHWAQDEEEFLQRLSGTRK